MKKDRGGSEVDLRSRAEDRLTFEPAESGELAAEAAREMIHELRLHQVELEIQNEELRNAQARIQESRARYSDLYDFAPIGYVSLDEKGVIRKANLTAEKQLGIERSQLIHKPFQVHVAREDQETFHLHLQSVFKSNERQTCEVKLASHGGVGLYIQMDGISVRDSSGATLCNLAMTDISERKRMEEELLKARKLEATGVLAGGIAHDFNNLLAVILGHVNMAELEIVSLIGGEPESGKRGLSELSSAKKAVFLSADLTRKFLTFASGGEPCKVSTRVQQLVRDSSALALSGSRIVCEHAFEDGLDEIDADLHQLRQAFYDVILNAREAMPGDEGSIRILVESSESDPADAERGFFTDIETRYVRISIRDEGVGISEQNLPRIFDPYFSTKNRGSQKGMGWGLATAHSIIKKHKGHIHVESEAGLGTTVDIYLPASGKRAANKRATEKPPVERRLRVLLMDDEKILRDMAGSMLDHLGHEAEVARDGVEAIELFCRARDTGAPFDVVIFDLTIRGGMGGKEAIQKLREIDPSVKAIVSSGYSNDAVVADFRRFGFDGVLPKPYQMRDLAEILREMMAD